MEITKTYEGCKLIHGTPMTRLEYNQLRGWNLPADENGDDPGFLVEYLDGGSANHPDYQGYISWSPEKVFRKSYMELEGPPRTSSFAYVLHKLCQGAKAARLGWNGVGMWIFLVPGSQFAVNRPPLLGIYPEGHEITYRPHIDMRTVNGEIVPWVASQSDLLSDDWYIVE